MAMIPRDLRTILRILESGSDIEKKKIKRNSTISTVLFKRAKQISKKPIPSAKSY